MADKTKDFPFLHHEATKTYIKKSKVMFIMRGLSGSGKSTVVGLIQENYPEHRVCSADDYFLQENGEYKHDMNKLTAAHESCQTKADQACKDSVPVVIIDNTHVRRWEMKFYVELASKYSYATVVVTPKTSWYLDAHELAKKNKHNVPESVLKQKVVMFMKENVCPLYWGWFVNDAATDLVLNRADTYFKQCVENCEEFNAFFMKHILGPGMEMTFHSLYNRNNASSRTLHCTAFYAGRQNSYVADEYAQSSDVVKAMGKAFALTVIGFVITPRTVGARVKLSDKQLKLWGKDDDEEEGGEGAAGSMQQMTSRFGQLDMLDEDNSQDDEDEKQPQRFRPTFGLGSRAHLTLGCVDGVKALETGLNQIQVIKREEEDLDEPDFVSIDGAAIRYYGQGRCVVYLDEPIKMPSLFSGRYY